MLALLIRRLKIPVLHGMACDPVDVWGIGTQKNSHRCEHLFGRWRQMMWLEKHLDVSGKPPCPQYKLLMK